MSNDASQFGWQPSMMIFPQAQHPRPVVMLPHDGVSYKLASNGDIQFSSLLDADMTQQQLRATEVMANGKGGSVGCSGDKVSHKSVEKLRRDRINMLIEELRELVPPSDASVHKVLEGPESRRPKHVVLSDAITLLRNMKNTPQQQPQPLQPPQQPQHQHMAAGPVHAHHSGQDTKPPHGAGGTRQTTSGTKSNSSCSEQDEVAGTHGPPQLPVIPMRPSAYRGVLVEKGPNCLYVQVKCRDRRGLLSDIINALHSLPLEIRTASVTTASDGSVHDVFDVRPDNPDMPPEEVQNLVHDALFQPLECKRAR